jgi:hypothetical protein
VGHHHQKRTSQREQFSPYISKEEKGKRNIGAFGPTIMNYWCLSTCFSALPKMISIKIHEQW